MPATLKDRERFLRMSALGRSTGNLSFDGDVEIEGNVKDDAHLKATGSIVVRGSVLGGSLEAGAELTVRGTVRNQSVLKAAGDIFVRRVEHARLDGASEVFVAGDAEFCSLRATGTLHVGGRIIGGRTEVDEGLVAGALGERGGVRTEIVLDPGRRRAEEIRRLETELEQLRSRLMFLRSVEVLQRVRGERAKLVRMAERVAAADETLAAEFRAALKSLVIARTKSLDPLVPRVDVSLGLYPGVDLQINAARLVVRSLLPPGILVERDGHIHTQVDARRSYRSF